MRPASLGRPTLSRVAVALMLAGLTGGLSSLPARAASDEGVDVRVLLELVTDDVDHPVLVTHAGDSSGILYVPEKAGHVRVLLPDGSLGEEPLLDIRDRVKSDEFEQGLLGLAFHPAFESNGRMFVNYTRAPDGATVISEFLVQDGRADPATERLVLLVPQPHHAHNAGMLAFDAAGGLVASLGDGGFRQEWRWTAQDPSSLLGKILRLDVDAPDAAGTIPQPEILAMGLRNPWRFSIDPVLGHIYIGDVGLHAWEEVNVLPSGSGLLNFGWSELEGPQCGPVGGCDPAAHVPPAIAYPHDPFATVIGGYAYRGAAQQRLEGLYVFGDHSMGAVLAAPLEDMLEGAAVPEIIGGLPSGGISSLGEDENGELYIAGPLGIFRITVDPDALPGPPPALPELPRAPEVRSLAQLTDISHIEVRDATVEIGEPVTPTVLYTNDLTLAEDGACLTTLPTGIDPYVALPVPSGVGLRVRSDDGGALQVFLEVGGVMIEGQSRWVELTTDAIDILMPPVSGVDGHVIRLDPPVGTTTTICLFRFEPPASG